MGIDIHIGNHYYAVLHVPRLALLLLLLGVLYAVWKLGGIALAATIR